MQGGQQLGSFFGQKGNDPTTGIIDCIGFAYLTLQVGDTGNVHNFSIVITWYSDSGGTNIVNTSTIVPVPGSNVSYQIDLVSRYARVTESHQIFGDTENIGGIVFGSNVQVQGSITGPQGLPLISFSGSLGPGANSTINALYTTWGPATLAASNESGNTWAVQINYYDITSATFKILVNVQGSAHGADVVLRISLPACPIQMVITNVGGSAAILDGTVTLG